MSNYTSLRDAIQKGVYAVIDPGIHLMIKMGVTPNMITTIGFLGNVLAGAMFCYSAVCRPLSDYSLVGWAGVVLIAFSIYGMIDGRLARVGHMSSTFGAFYDSVLDRYSELVTLCGIAFYFLQHGLLWAALVTMLALIGSIMVSYVRARAEGLDIECKVGLMQRPERVVLTSVGAMLCGFLAPVVQDVFEPYWILLIPMILIALLANYTAIVRILHVKGEMASQKL